MHLKKTCLSNYIVNIISDQCKQESQQTYKLANAISHPPSIGLACIGKHIGKNIICGSIFDISDKCRLTAKEKKTPLTCSLYALPKSFRCLLVNPTLSSIQLV